MSGETKQAFDLRVGDRVMYLYDDGQRRPRPVRWVGWDGDYRVVEYEDGHRSTFGPRDYVLVNGQGRGG